MFELIRVFLGYCMNCRLPKVVGEFKLLGWKHSFNLCSICLRERKEELEKREQELARQLYAEPSSKERIMIHVTDSENV